MEQIACKKCGHAMKCSRSSQAYEERLCWNCFEAYDSARNPREPEENENHQRGQDL